mmetsp:Transcript_65267/g.199680  ORF Transcript_65267/g.199680 Transcript_65267/m.199680 type:complete len:290 (+) Transcript_65267:338-1207(+)
MRLADIPPRPEVLPVLLLVGRRHRRRREEHLPCGVPPDQRRSVPARVLRLQKEHSLPPRDGRPVLLLSPRFRKATGELLHLLAEPLDGVSLRLGRAVRVREVLVQPGGRGPRLRGLLPEMLPGLTKLPLELRALGVPLQQRLPHSCQRRPVSCLLVVDGHKRAFGRLWQHALAVRRPELERRRHGVALPRRGDAVPKPSLGQGRRLLRRRRVVALRHPRRRQRQRRVAAHNARQLLRGRLRGRLGGCRGTAALVGRVGRPRLEGGDLLQAALLATGSSRSESNGRGLAP